MPNQHGGARLGAGRKPNAEKYATEIEQAKRKIADRLPELVETHLALALGKIRAEDDEGKIYEVKPDRTALEYLQNRVMGKPVERQEVEMSGPDGGAILHTFGSALSKAYGDGTVTQPNDNDPDDGR